MAMPEGMTPYSALKGRKAGADSATPYSRLSLKKPGSRRGTLQGEAGNSGAYQAAQCFSTEMQLGLAIAVPREGLNIEKGESVIKKDGFIKRNILGNSESFRTKVIQKDIAATLKA